VRQSLVLVGKNSVNLPDACREAYLATAGRSFKSARNGIRAYARRWSRSWKVVDGFAAVTF
jgi:hypothetical protein